jgi:type IV pilus assembly protein PilQ
VTEAIKVNNAEPSELADLIKSMVSPEIGKVAIDTRSRHIVVTDQPVVLEQVRDLIKQVDMPVKQVSVDAMIVDAVMANNSETGVDWVSKAVHSYDAQGHQIGSLVGPVAGTDATGDQIVRDVVSDMTAAGTGFLSLGLLTDRVNIKAAIAAQIDNSNARLLANPVVVTVENQKATINISNEIPYQESKQSLTGPPMVSTAFKDIGILLEVTPKVSHDDHILAKINAKQSHQSGVFNNIPIEAKRTTETTLRTKNGQTIFIGGLRRLDDSTQAKKVPVLGDIPVLNILFRNNVIQKQSTELLVFLTCNVLPDEIAPLSPELQSVHDELDNTPKVPTKRGGIGRTMLRPKEVTDREWHWRRSE